MAGLALALLAIAMAVLALKPETEQKRADRLPLGKPSFTTVPRDAPVPPDRPIKVLKARPVEPVPVPSDRPPAEWLTPPPNPIDVGEPRRVRTERLDATNQVHLTSEEAALVRLYVEGADSSALMGTGALTGGAELPDDTRLRPFPADLVGRVPRLGGRSYVVAGDAIAIVDPEMRRIGQVLKP
jgi:hypothetical protein